jgi:hypothetical protein
LHIEQVKTGQWVIDGVVGGDLEPMTGLDRKKGVASRGQNHNEALDTADIL